jgi:glycosyltransferase involved in cell wall biosynthesis
MNHVAVDIIIATYNRCILLQEALKSILNQSFSSWRCWVAEDGATQETADAIEPFLKDERFIYLPGKHAGFPAVARNRAIRQGNAEYVAMSDDDDLWLPQKLERQTEFLKNHPGCVVLGCNAFFWTREKQWHESPLYFKKLGFGKIDYNTLLLQNYIIHSSVMIRRTALEKAGLYNEDLGPPIGEDYELWLRLGALGEIWTLPEPYVIYRKTPETYYSKLSRSESYRASANLFESALKGTEGKPSPLSYPENAHLAAACRRQRNFYRGGPRFLGRFRHKFSSKIKTIFNA